MAKALNAYDRLRIEFNNAVSPYTDLYADVLVQAGGRDVEVRLFRGDRYGSQYTVAPTLTPAIETSINRTLSQYGVDPARTEIFIDRLCIPMQLLLINAL